jgi:transposase
MAWCNGSSYDRVHLAYIIDMKTRLTNAAKSKMTIVGAAMRKLVHLIYGVLKNGVPFDPNDVSRKV